MSGEPDAGETLRSSLIRFLETAGTVWDRYRAAGPSRVDPALHAPVAAAAQALEEQLRAPLSIGGRVWPPGGNEAAWRREALATVRRVAALSERCACTSLGLCFITGEAGLIPRPDLHAAYEEGLSAVAARVAEVQTALTDRGV